MYIEPFLASRSPRAASLVILVILLSLAVPVGAAEEVKVFAWSLTPQSRALIQGLERVWQRSLPVIAADGDPEKAVQISRQLAQEKLPVLVVLGTPALQAAAPRMKRTLLVFAMVADPYQTGVAYDRSRPWDHQENATGIASPPPLLEALQQTQTLFPQRRHWGLLYNPFEGTSLELQQEFTALARQAGLTVTVRSANAAAAAQAAVQLMVAQGVEVFFLPPDQFSQTYGPLLLAMGGEQRLMVVNGNPRLNPKGAVLSVTLDYEAVGEEAGRLLQRLLAGEKPKTIPIRQFSPVRIEVDEKLLSRWAGYPPGNREKGKDRGD
ncbi:MAG: ABC transporter substrate-binding protein [Desulfobacca sp.]|uniref:ABC transporter substrate-binding protein n=1 Tax=Desulfobacca sp. TaxID=2067990 RepID=UPI004049AC91